MTIYPGKPTGCSFVCFSLIGYGTSTCTQFWNEYTPKTTSEQNYVPSAMRMNSGLLDNVCGHEFRSYISDSFDRSTCLYPKSDRHMYYKKKYLWSSYL